MTKKHEKIIGIRLPAKVAKELQEEGAKKGLALSAYIRYLLFTHQERK